MQNNTNQRFNDYSSYFTEKFGGRMQKLAINAGFTCPNRDGKVAVGGCTFCINEAFNPSYCESSKSVTQQITEGIEFHKKRYRRSVGFLAYFQAFSNTYAKIEHLRKIYTEALSINDVAGIIIGTRPDCISDEILELLAEINKTKYVIIEYGIESCFDDTLIKINRGHTFQQAKDAIIKTNAYNIPCGAHFIFGLPDETTTQMLEYAAIISELPLTTVKFHQLQIFKNTVIEKEYIEAPQRFKLFELDEYIDFIIDFTERLNPQFIIERFAGEAPPRFLVVSKWGLMRYDQVLNKIKKRMEERDTWQGRLFHKDLKSL